MDVQIGVLKRDAVVARIEPARAGMCGAKAHAAQHGTDFPNVRTNDELGAHAAANIGGQDAGVPAIL